MGLVDLTTDLKSLRYGQDRVGGGSSKEPFVTKPVDGTPGDTGGPDFLLRANTLENVGNDLERLGKYFLSPKGLQFAAKQNVLSRTAVRGQSVNGPINEGIYLPTSTLLQSGANPFGTHLLKQGINPFADTTADGSTTGINVIDNILNATLPLSAPFYVKKIGDIKNINNNRLLQLKDAKIGVATDNPNTSFLNQLFSGGGFLNELGGNLIGNVKNIFSKNFSGTIENNISGNDDELIRYDGGPGSALGIGQTALKRYVNSSDYTLRPDYANENARSFFTLNNSQISGMKASVSDRNQTGPSSIGFDFRTSLLPQQEKSNVKNVLSTSLNYKTQGINNRVHVGDPGRRNKNTTNYTVGAGTESGGNMEPLDKINALPIYSSKGVISQDFMGVKNIKNDLIKFRIGILDNRVSNGKKTYIHFRAFIDEFSDNYESTWETVNYMGRAENFYRFGGFNRSINIGWTVAAQSLPELIPMYQKLNYLASSLAGDYSEFGYMQGNIAYLTLGGYCYEQPGIITSMNLTYPSEGTWEIDLSSETGARDGGAKTKELPHIMTVSGFNFIPIHNFVPRLQQNTYLGQKASADGRFISDWGQEQFIALENESGNNYEGKNTFTPKSPKISQEPADTTVNTPAVSQGLQ